MEPQPVVTSYKFGHYHGEGMINSPYMQQTNTTKDSLLEFEFVKVSNINDNGLVKYGDVVAIRSRFHAHNDSTNVNRPLKRQYISLVKTGKSTWHMRTTLATHTS